MTNTCEGQTGGRGGTNYTKATQESRTDHKKRGRGWTHKGTQSSQLVMHSFLTFFIWFLIRMFCGTVKIQWHTLSSTQPHTIKTTTFFTGQPHKRAFSLCIERFEASSVSWTSSDTISSPVLCVGSDTTTASNLCPSLSLWGVTGSKTGQDTVSESSHAAGQSGTRTVVWVCGQH